MEDEIFPNDIYRNIQTVTKGTANIMFLEEGIGYRDRPDSVSTQDKIFPLSISELGFPSEARATETPSTAYAYFSNNNRRKFGVDAASRSCCLNPVQISNYTDTSRHGVTEDGEYCNLGGIYDVWLYMPIAFVIG